MSSKRRRSTSVQQVNHELLAQIVAPSSIAAAAGNGPARPVRKLSHTDLTPGVELFQEVHSPQGADAVRKFYNAYSTGCSRWLSGPSRTAFGGHSLDRLLMEAAFIAICRHLLGWPRYECTELLDILDCSGAGGVGPGEFYIMVAILCAKTDTQRRQALYIHGQRMYTVFRNAEPGHQWAVLRMWGMLLGVDSHSVLKAVNALGLASASAVSAQDFEALLYRAIRCEEDVTLRGNGAVAGKGRSRKGREGVLGSGDGREGESEALIATYKAGLDVDSIQEQHEANVKCGCLMQ